MDTTEIEGVQRLLLAARASVSNCPRAPKKAEKTERRFCLSLIEAILSLDVIRWLFYAQDNVQSVILE